MGKSQIYTNNLHNSNFYKKNTSKQPIIKNIIDVEYKIIDDDMDNMKNNNEK